MELLLFATVVLESCADVERDRGHAGVACRGCWPCAVVAQAADSLPDPFGYSGLDDRGYPRPAACAVESRIGISALSAATALSGRSLYLVAGLPFQPAAHFIFGNWLSSIHHHQRGFPGSSFYSG